MARPIELFYWPTPNGKKITIALDEMGLPYEIKPVNIGAGDQFKPEFLAISPNNRMPAIFDDEPKDGGGPLSIFESGAILLYLGMKTGQFWPQDRAAQVPVLEWLMFQMGGFGPMPGQVHHFIALAEEADRRYGLQRFMAETRRLYGVMDRRLAEHAYFGGSDMSIADFAIVGWAWRHPRHQVDLAEFPNVRRWYEQMMARPATARGFEVALKR